MPSSLPPNPTNSRLVVVFGDSITEGNSLPDKERSNAWVPLVERLSQGPLKLINEGQGGRPTNSVAEFVAMLKRHSRMDLLVLALGANDARDISGHCVSNAIAHLRNMIDKARQAFGPTLQILLVAPTNIRKDALGPTREIGNERDANLRALAIAYETLAMEENCAFTSLYGLIPPECLTRDGVHPDSRGHALIATAILPQLLALVG